VLALELHSFHADAPAALFVLLLLPFLIIPLLLRALLLLLRWKWTPPPAS
jgi:hypothetical protein